MNQPPPSDDLTKFNETYGLIERALRHAGVLQKGQDRAYVDWKAFSSSLGDDFFKAILGSGEASVLISEPPGELKNRDQKAVWEKSPALGCVQDLFIRGVCKVRANVAHHEKFVGNEVDQRRDATLVKEALYVLLRAISASPALRGAIEKIS